MYDAKPGKDTKADKDAKADKDSIMITDPKHQ